MPNTIGPAEIIGTSIDEGHCIAFLQSLGDYFEISSFSNVTSLSFPSKGIEIQIDDSNTVSAIFLYPSYNSENYGQFSGELPHGLEFGDSRRLVRSKLGVVESQNKNGAASIWDRFRFNDYFLTVTYINNLERINLITLFKAELAAQ